MSALQRVGISVGVVLWLCSLALAPWETQSVILDRALGRPGDYLFRIEWSPLIHPPTSQHGPPRLRLDVLAVEWIAIGLLVAGGFRVFRAGTVGVRKPATQESSREVHESAVVRLSTAIAACVVVATLVAILTAYVHRRQRLDLPGFTIIPEEVPRIDFVPDRSPRK